MCTLEETGSEALPLEAHCQAARLTSRDLAPRDTENRGRGADAERRRLTPAPRVHVRVVLVVEVRLVQVPEGLELHLGVLEKAQLHQQCQPHKPKLETRWKQEVTRA